MIFGRFSWLIVAHSWGSQSVQSTQAEGYLSVIAACDWARRARSNYTQDVCLCWLLSFNVFLLSDPCGMRLFTQEVVCPMTPCKKTMEMEWNGARSPDCCTSLITNRGVCNIDIHWYCEPLPLPTFLSQVIEGYLCWEKLLFFSSEIGWCEACLTDRLVLKFFFFQIWFVRIQISNFETRPRKLMSCAIYAFHMFTAMALRAGIKMHQAIQMKIALSDQMRFADAQITSWRIEGDRALGSPHFMQMRKTLKRIGACEARLQPVHAGLQIGRGAFAGASNLM